MHRGALRFFLVPSPQPALQGFVRECALVRTLPALQTHGTSAFPKVWWCRSIRIAPAELPDRLDADGIQRIPRSSPRLGASLRTSVPRRRRHSQMGQQTGQTHPSAPVLHLMATRSRSSCVTRRPQVFFSTFRATVISPITWSLCASSRA